ACLDETITSHGPNRGRVERDGGERERLIAAPEARLRIPPLDVSRAGPPPAHHLETKIVDRAAVLESASGVLEASIPGAKVARDRNERPQGSARPPDVAASFERFEGPLTDLDGVSQVPRYRQDVSQAALGVRPDLVEAARVGDRQGLAAVRDRLLGPA